MTISKRWVILLTPVCQTLIAINLGMALQRWDDGHASGLTAIAILIGVVGLALIGIGQTREKLAEARKDHIGSIP